MADTFAIGAFRVTRIVEWEASFQPLLQMFPMATEEALSALRPRLHPWALDSEDRVILPAQSYLVETGRHTILLDTCIGCGKTMPRFPAWHMRTDTGWLDRLSAVVAPEAVTHVLCTHLHPDHAGWNTRLLDGRWVPTFPNAAYIFAHVEVAHAKAHEQAIYNESVLPVIEAGQSVMVETDHQIEDGIWLEPIPGHTPGHVAIHLTSQGVHAVMWGDLLHTPAQFVHTDWSYRRDTKPDLSARSRRRVLGEAAEHRRIVLPAHFPSPSVCTIQAEGDGFWFAYGRD